MSRNYFRVFGAFILFVGPALLIQLVDPGERRALPRLFVLIAAIELIGFGLVFQRKWAAIYFSTVLFIVGIQNIWDSIYEIPFPFNLLVMLIGFSFTAPLILTIRQWQHLTWGRRFF